MRAPASTSLVPQRHLARSHGDVLQDLAADARERFSPAGGAAARVPGWDPGRRTGHGEVDLGRGVLDSVALALHVLWTYQQAWAEEGYLATARLPSSIDKLLAHVGYRPRPGAASTGLAHLRARAGAPGWVPAGFQLASPAKAGEPEAIFETLEPVRIDPLLNELRAFLPPPAPGTGGAGTGGGVGTGGGGAGSGGGAGGGPFGSGADGEPKAPAGGLFDPPSALAGIEERLDALRHGSLDARRRARAKQKARDLARMINLVDAAGQAACKDAFDGLCEQLCEAQKLASQGGPASDAPASLSESQELLQRQLRNLSRRQKDAIAALEAAMKRCPGETAAQYAARLDKLAEFLDAFVGSMIQEARDQLVLLRGVDVVSRLDQAFGGSGAIERGLALPGADALYLPPIAGLDGAEVDPPVRAGDWLAVGTDTESIDATGKVTVTRAYHEAVRVVRVAREVPRGEKRALLKIQFVPPLAGRYPLDRAVLLGNLAPISHGKTVVEELVPAPDRRTAPLKQGPLTWLRDPVRPRGRAAPVSLTVAGRAWRQVDDLLAAGPEEPVFAVEPAPGGEMRLRFGDGANGAPLPAGARVTASYRTGLGTAGNRAAGRIDGLAASHPSIEAAFNPLATTGGADPEDRGRARSLGPLAVGATDRAVSIGDVTALALAYDGVSRARVVRDPRRPRQLSVIVAGAGGAALAAGELAGLAAYLRERVAPGIAIAVENRVLVPIKLALLVRYHRGADPIALVAAVRARLGVDDAERPGLLDPDRVGLGDDLSLSAIYGALDGLPGLHSAVVGKLHRADDPPALHQQVRAAGRELLAWAAQETGAGVAISYEEGSDR